MTKIIMALATPLVSAGVVIFAIYQLLMFIPATSEYFKPASELEKLTILGISHREDFVKFKDEGGLNSSPAWHGLYVTSIQSQYNGPGETLSALSLEIGGKAKWMQMIKKWTYESGLATKDIRQVLSKICQVDESQWKHTDGDLEYGTVETAAKTCAYSPATGSNKTIFVGLSEKNSDATDRVKPIDSVPVDDYEVLISRANNYITEWNKENPLCDQIEAPGFSEIRRGKVTFIATGGGNVDPPIPAIVAKMSGICVIESLRKREPIDKFWMMMAYDKVLSKYTCVKVGGESLIQSFIEKNCEFVQDSSGISKITVANQNDTSTESTGVEANSRKNLQMPTTNNRASEYLENHLGTYKAQCSQSERVLVQAGSIFLNIQDIEVNLQDLDVSASYFGNSPPEDFEFAISGTDTGRVINVSILFWNGKNGPELSIDNTNPDLGIKSVRLVRCS